MAVRNLPLGEVHPSTSEAVTVQPMTFWFWIKAGMGFTLGSSIIGFIGLMLWARVLLPWYLRVAFRGL